MSNVIKKRVSESEGKRIKIFLNHKHFKFEGKVTNFDENYFEILDDYSGSYKTFRYEDIKECEVAA